MRFLRAYFARVLLVALRWAVPTFIVFSDLAIVYTLGSSVLSALPGARRPPCNPMLPACNPVYPAALQPYVSQVLSALLGFHRGQTSVSSWSQVTLHLHHTVPNPTPNPQPQSQPQPQRQSLP